VWVRVFIELDHQQTMKISVTLSRGQVLRFPFFFILWRQYETKDLSSEREREEPNHTKNWSIKDA